MRECDREGDNNVSSPSGARLVDVREHKYTDNHHLEAPEVYDSEAACVYVCIVYTYIRK